MGLFHIRFIYVISDSDFLFNISFLGAQQWVKCVPDKPIICVESAQAFFFAWYVSIKCLTIVPGDWREISTLFETFFLTFG
jgi:hypothetical protein